LAPAATDERQRRSVRIRHTRRLAHGRLDDDAQDYRDEVGRLYLALATVTGADLIVDSSKVPAGAAVAAQIDGVDSYLLQMVRDPRAVAYSWMRTKVQPDRKMPTQMVKHTAADSGMSWLAWNLLIEDVARRGYPGRHIRLRYEDFIAGPEAAMAAVFALVGLAPGARRSSTAAPCASPITTPCPGTRPGSMSATCRCGRTTPGGASSPGATGS
jgi:hypothetical protein